LVISTSARPIGARHEARAALPHFKDAEPISICTKPKASPAKKKEHCLILQVNSNDPAAMNLALNNSTNIVQHYDIGEKVKI